MTDEEDCVDEIRNALQEEGGPVPWGDGLPSFTSMAEAVYDTIKDELVRRIRSCVEAGFDATMDVDGPNYEVMAQLVYDRFLQDPVLHVTVQKAIGSDGELNVAVHGALDELGAKIAAREGGPT